MDAQEEFERLLDRLVAIENQIEPHAKPLDPTLVLDELRRLAVPWAQRWGETEMPTAGVCQAPGLGNLLTAHLARSANSCLAVEHVQLLRLSDAIFRHLATEADLDPMAQQVLCGLQPAVVSQWLSSPEAMLLPSHPVRRLFELLVRVTRGLDEQAGKHAFSLAAKIRKHLVSTVEPVLEARSALMDTIAKLTDLLNRHQHEVRQQELRLIGQERGEIQLTDTRRLVTQEIRQRIEGRTLPRALIGFLTETWEKYLQATYLTEGPDSPSWQQGLETVDELIWSVTLRDADTMRGAYSDRINPMLVRLRRGAASVQSGSESFDSFMEQLDAVHIAIMAGDEPDPDQMALVPGEHRPSSSVVSLHDRAHPRLPEIRALRPGEWLHWHDGERERRCRLVENDRSLGYLLLGNLSGIRVARLDHVDAAEALATGRLRPIAKSPVFDRLLRLALQDWRAHLEKRVQVLARTLRERQAQETQARMEADAQRAREIQEAQRREQERLERERRQAEALAEEKQRQEAERRAREEAETARRAQQEARAKAITQRTLELERLQPGAVVELINGQDQPMTCKLALVLRSSRKMVFVDHIGRRVAELRPEELAVRVVEGSAQVRDFGTAFDEKLHQLIKQRSDTMPVT
jgi:hypothetical protein